MKLSSIFDGSNFFCSLVVTILHYLLHIFGLTFPIEKLKAFLKSAHKKKIPDVNIFQDKFCPVSGFAINMQCL